MPNLVNKEYRDATLQLTNLDLNLVVNDPVEEYSSITKGYVIRTIPEYGETLQEGDSVTLVVSKGEQPKPVKVLSFIGIDIEIVRQQVTQTGLVVGEVTQRASDEPYGTVIDQSINAETQVDAGTTITSLSAKAPPCRTTAMTPRPPEGNRSRERKNTARTERLLLCQMRGRQLYTCKARGKFRREGISPLVGDDVEFCEVPGGEGRIDEILPRRNSFDRPSVANIDQMVIVCSQAIPKTDPYLVDRMTAIARSRAATCSSASTSAT
mgnify:CR=1 FL=1